MNPTGDEFLQEIVLSEKHFHEHNFAGFQVQLCHDHFIRLSAQMYKSPEVLIPLRFELLIFINPENKQLDL